MEDYNKILQLAKEASNHAYCPYSEFAVGACCVFENGNIYTGCNVENSSYGLSLCAERNAISSAIVKGEKSRLVKLSIYSPKAEKCFPCGACLQWIYEFAKGYNTEIILEDKDKKVVIYGINELFPHPFVI